MDTTRSSWFCKWLQHLGESPFLAAAEDSLARQILIIEEENHDDDMGGGVDNDMVVMNNVDEFNHLNLTRGVSTIADEDIFALADKEQQQLNVIDGSTA